jgi:integrase
LDVPGRTEDEHLLILQNQEENKEDPFSSFMYGLKAAETRRQWPARLKKFFDFGINPKLETKKQAAIFYEKASSNENWAVFYMEKFIEFQKERVVKREIESTTIRNYYKAAKLFCDMNDITLNWKRLSKGLPKQKQASDDRAPTREEIKRLLDYPDKRIKPILLTMLSSGIRKEAWDYLKWKHIVPIIDIHDNTIIIAAKIIVYAGDNEEYFSFITPEAYNSLKEWMDFRAFHGEGISGNSWVMRNLFTVSERTWKRDPNHSNYLGDINEPVQLSSDGVKSMIERAIHAQGLWSPLKEGSRRREWKGMHGFRKFFKTQAEHLMKSLHVEMMLGHNTGLAKNYYRPSERELLEEYIKAIDHLTINEENRLSKQVQELKEKNQDSEYVIKGKLQEKEEQIKNLEESVKFLSDRFNAFLISQPENKIIYHEDKDNKNNAGIVKGIELKSEIHNKAVGKVISSNSQ